MPGKSLLHRGRLMLFYFMHCSDNIFSLISDPGEVILDLYSVQFTCSSSEFSLFLER